jgi:hypothetical protein
MGLVDSLRAYSTTVLAIEASHISVPAADEKLAADIDLWHASEPLDRCRRDAREGLARTGGRSRRRQTEGEEGCRVGDGSSPPRSGRN